MEKMGDFREHFLVNSRGHFWLIFWTTFFNINGKSDTIIKQQSNLTLPYLTYI